MDPASRRLPVKMRLKTNVSMLPRSLQLTALAIDRGCESRARMNIGCSPATDHSASRARCPSNPRASMSPGPAPHEGSDHNPSSGVTLLRRYGIARYEGEDQARVMTHL